MMDLEEGEIKDGNAKAMPKPSLRLQIVISGGDDHERMNNEEPYSLVRPTVTRSHSTGVAVELCDSPSSTGIDTGQFYRTRSHSSINAGIEPYSSLSYYHSARSQPSADFETATRRRDSKETVWKQHLRAEKLLLPPNEELNWSGKGQHVE